jgi:hypothetical protein
VRAQQVATQMPPAEFHVMFASHVKFIDEEYSSSTAAAAKHHITAYVMVLLLSCRHYLQCWARHACSK